MKQFLVITMFFVSMFIHQQSSAQVNVTVNIGSQPAWGPVGHDYVDYYYLPDVDAYYYVPQQQYIYLESNRWIFAPALPPRFSWYDPYRYYKVVINEPKPYLRHNVYQVKYKKYKGWKSKQVVIRDKHNNGNKATVRAKGQGKSHGNKGHGKGKKH